MSSITVGPHHYQDSHEQNLTFCTVQHDLRMQTTGETCREYDVTKAILILRGANVNPAVCEEFINVSMFFNQFRMGMCFNNSIEIELRDIDCNCKCKLIVDLCMYSVVSDHWFMCPVNAILLSYCMIF